MQNKQTKGLNRNTIDKYYTKPSIVELCLTHLRTHITIREEDFIIEPSAGNGAFISGIRSLSGNSIFYDIEPEHAEIVRQDFLQFCPNVLKTQYNNIHVIGNPPFGRQSSTAIQFIKKSCEFCHSLAFILPKSFKKDSLKKSFPLSYHLLFETDLPENSFLVEGIEHNVPCVFQIWQKQSQSRSIPDKLEPLHFIFVDKTENPDISFRRVGVNAGVIDTRIEEKSTQSHYFITFTNNTSIQENLALLSTITYDFNNTVGPKSISKQELIHKFNTSLR